jgi:hypothetical protein
MATSVALFSGQTLSQPANALASNPLTRPIEPQSKCLPDRSSSFLGIERDMIRQRTRSGRPVLRLHDSTHTMGSIYAR